MEQIDHHCECSVCIRVREFREYIEHVNGLEAKVWFDNLFCHLNDVENDLDAYKMYEKNLKTLYPKIWREVTTVKPLDVNDAEFPEIQLKQGLE